MAFSKDQKDPSLPTSNADVKKTAIDFLPKYFRTAANRKFLDATVDQMIDEGSVEKINAFLGRKTSRSYLSTDRYLEEVSPDREAYQFEPSLNVKDELENLTFFQGYSDYVNQVNFFNGSVIDHSKMNSQEFYAWNPHFDWDKFVNYREYFWLPNGPQPVVILGQSVDIASTYKVSISDEGNNVAYVFSPDGLTRNPTLRLYRGQTYRFEIDCPGYPIAIKTVRDTTSTFLYNDGVTKNDVFVEQGVIEFTVPVTAPNILYYVSSTSIDTSGIFSVFDITEATEIDVEKEILGKVTYTLPNGTDLSNGMKIYFQGFVTPEKYANGYWYVEGVGTSINLISERDLEIPAIYTSNENIEFDNEYFDTQGFDVNNNYPGTKDYITINRSSKDRNHWSRHNRWFHREVIEVSANLNNQPLVLDQSARAVRPIIEFNPNILLYKFGQQAKQNVDLVDTFTKDVFSTIEGQLGYNVDGVNLVEGYRVLFTADPDVRVNGRIYRVAFVTHLGTRRLTLIAEPDSDPNEEETVLVLQGNNYRGKMFYYKGGKWNIGQEKTGVNQAPLFDVFDPNGVSYSDKDVYPGSSFRGTKLFTYKSGPTQDSELGFGITYKNIENIGDIVFEYNLHSDTFIFQDLAEIKRSSLDKGYLKLYDGINSYFDNGWLKVYRDSRQYVIRQYDATETLRNFFPIDVYDNSGLLTDLEVKVLLNGQRQGILDFDVFRQDKLAYVQFFQDVAVGDSVVIKTYSRTPKNQNGYYEFPVNLESNPENLSLDIFTLGEIINHAQSIAENLPDFTASVPGPSNLRDLGNISSYGTKIVQHSAPLVPVVYHITNKKFNVVNALRYARKEYAKFKRNLLRVASTYGFDGDTKTHLDIILREITKDNVKDMPFYLSDMVPFGANFVFEQTVLDDSITDYPLTFDFNLDEPSEKAVLVYLNNVQLCHGSDYEFVNTSFIRIKAPINTDDDLKIVQYIKTDGCYCPATPTKLGLYPTYEPKIFIDNTYRTPTKVIQGHDGSITVAFNDFRDDLLLEFEKRVYNNIKVRYDETVFDIYDLMSGYFRSADVSLSEFNNVIRQDFLQWTSLISDDYTKHNFYDRNEQFTFNYNKFTAPDKQTIVPGFWRGIYKFAYDTDRPHTHPWEILGFSEQPEWWEDQYGPAPYTSDNLVLWNDIRDGVRRIPGQLPTPNSKFARPTILNHLPVDQHGNLLSPLSSGFVTNFVDVYAEGQFSFGDQTPTESAWRKSSEYPFALITALTLLRPAKMFALCFDRVRQYRDRTGQIVYKLQDGNLRFNTLNLVFPSTVDDNQRVFTSGLINYIVDYTISQSLNLVKIYKDDLANVKVNLASKLGGFASKDKFKILLDSRTPQSKGSVFLPEENYNIFLNTSTPILSISYSGVIVEKQPSGFIVKGYNRSVPEFKYYAPLERASDPVINVGGISENFVDWDQNKLYVKNKVVRYDNAFYRVTTAHTSSTTFETKYFTRLSALPVNGGRDIIVRTRFEEKESVLHYGAELLTVQDVVDFLLGYGRWLEEQGFDFDYYNPVLQTVTDWNTSAKEFAFWTTQNWAAGSVISLSPAADELIFQKDFAVVDNIYDNFYDYSIYKQDGNVLEPSFTNSVREKNNFTLRPRNTADGIYHATLNLVQKEHVLIIDNVSIFNDVLYDQKQGYRQDRIRVLGYRTTGWEGDFDAPGFVYDRASVFIWTPWKDYALGDTVKYKEFYYSAKNNVPGSETFNDSEWFRLPSRPEPKLIPNWDYRARQFADFYDLDTDSFDVDQQKFAQHLIGYQKRQYLENIINDDVSQYKFYQGMIQEKGTKNSLSKLFDVLNSADKDSLEFFEEWAIRLGQYGAAAGFDEVEYKLDESKFLINPQPIELVETVNESLNDFVYRIKPHEVYLRPDGYSHSPLPLTDLRDEYIPTAGYVNPEDVQYIVRSKEDILKYDILSLKEGDYFWVGFDKTSWNVYRFGIFAKTIVDVSVSDTGVKFITAGRTDPAIVVDSIVGFANTIKKLTRFFTVVEVGPNYFVIENIGDITEQDLNEINETQKINCYKLSSQRISNVDDLNSLNLNYKKSNETVWVDNLNSDWQVWKYNNQYTKTDISYPISHFARNLAVDDQNKSMAVVADNRILYFTRPTSKFAWSFVDQLTILSTVDSVNVFNTVEADGTFGDSIAMSANGQYLVVGIPGSNRVSGDSSLAQNEGYVSVFKKNPSGFYTLHNNIISPTRNPEEFFGYRVLVTVNYIVIAAKGSLSNPASVSVYSLSTGLLVDQYVFDLGLEVLDVAVSNTNRIVVSTTDETVTVLDFTTSITVNSEIKYSELEDIEVPTGSNFATSVAITKDATTIAVGAPLYDNINPDQGAVILYKLSEGEYEYFDILTAKNNQESGQFGHRVVFNSIGNQLVVYSKGGNQITDTIFDNNETTYDLNTTRFYKKEDFVGTVKVFDKYNDKFLFADELKVDDVLGTAYGSSVVVTDRIYVNDPFDDVGLIYEFVSPTKSWSVVRTPNAVVNINKIKSIFLYNTRTSQIVSNLDFIDPVRGKINGLSEQEISFKTFYDPAVYSVGDDNVVVDNLMNWKSGNVGKLWWDLSTVKFLDANQGSILYKANTWNTIFPGSSVDVYEWVETEYLPEEWNALADTEEGLTIGISGTTKYGNDVYSLHRVYDSISETFKNVYYFWVKNKTIVPDLEGRNISAKDVADYIEDPKSKGLRYIALHSSNQLSLVNCEPLMANQDIALNIRYWVSDNSDSNIHSHYQLLAEGEITAKINKYIEQKWFDSLIGFDIFGKEVPDTRLPDKLKYGTLSRPRQSMFVNRLEALKQFIERVNSVLIKKSIIDDFDFSDLNSRDPEPNVESGIYDELVDLHSNLRFVSTVNKRRARLTPVISDGRIIRVNILDPGKGYKVPPNITIVGSGLNAQLKASINAAGEITRVEVEKFGTGYSAGTSLSVRPFTVLIQTDETSNGKWTLYTLNTDRTWFKEKTQTFDTTKYWQYADWYAEGYNTFARVDYVVDFAYQIPSKRAAIGETVRVENFGSGGWLLLEKVNNLDTLETTVNYKVIGRQNGTIQFRDNLYRFANNNVGFDGPSYDADLFDEQPKEELRIILNTIKNNIFVDDLEVEYNKLFFASLRYAFNEQPFIDWAFKTSFVKSRHNLGQLEQKVTFKNDNLDDYEDYINEVKPYRSKIREFISGYDRLERTNTQVTDFDLPARYNFTTDIIEPFKVSIKGSTIDYNSSDILKQPYSDWYYNVGYEVTEIIVHDSGSGYIVAPTVEIVGACASPASATAFVSRGKVTKIVIDDPGFGYITSPIVNIVGATDVGGVVARAVAILGNGLVRSPKIDIKFDRLSPKYTVSTIVVEQTFTGTGSLRTFPLTWPADTKGQNIFVTVDNGELLSTEYTVYNTLDTLSSYKRHKGFLDLSLAPAAGSTIFIRYQKNIDLLDAADRIQYFYNPKSGQIGKDLGQLMQGVDYGGVEITGISFDIGAGWDALPWFAGGWDNFDESYNNVYIRIGSDIEREYTLPYIPNDGEMITVYWQRGTAFYRRIDDPNYVVVSAAQDILNQLQDELDILLSELAVLQQDLENKQAINDQTFNNYNDAIVGRDAAFAFLNTLSPADPEYPAAEANYQFYLGLVATTLAIYQSANADFVAAQLAVSNKQTEIDNKEDEVDAAQADLNALTQIDNLDALMNTYFGNGVDAGPIVIPSNVDLQEDDIIIIRRFASDGSFVPEEQFYDTKVSGGDLAYSTATGIDAAEIIIDGDGFVTPTTSHAPEEVVTGQVVDTVDIQVYHKVSDGSPVIVTRHYKSDAEQIIFDIGQRPGTSNSVFVSISGLIKKQDIDYVVNYETQTVQLAAPAPLNEDIVITSLSQNGSKIIDLDFFTGDGSTKEFITVARWDLEYSVFVTVDGSPTEVETFKTNSTYAKPNNIGLRFATAPAADAIINYTVLGTSVNTISRIQRQTIITDESTSSYNLTTKPQFIQPLENSVIVEIDGHVIKPADTIYFIVSGNNRTFTVSTRDYAFNSIDPNEINVFVNGQPKQISVDYTWVSATNELKLKRGAASSGDKVALTIIKNAEYIITNDNVDQLTLLNTYPAGTVVTVTTFTNHDILDIERTNDFIRSASEVTPGTVEYYQANQYVGGRIKLRRPAISAQYLWVSLNNELLKPQIDYILEDNKNYIRIDANRGLVATDIIDIVHFGSNVTKQSFGYRIFKDMLNKNTYNRIDDTVSTTLERPLNYYDSEMYVVDASRLPEPARDQNKGGVVFVEGERIEYLKKNGNVLGQLRRGTLGTGTKAIYEIGTLVRDQSSNQIVPYKDEFISNVSVYDGSSIVIPLDFIPMKSVVDSGKSVVTVQDWIDDGFETALPVNYLQADDIEVFIGGRRLRKNPGKVWDEALGPDSVNGDKFIDAEFAVDGQTAEVLLNIDEADLLALQGTTVIVQKRVGKTWAPTGTSLADSTSNEAAFLRARSADLPE